MADDRALEALRRLERALARVESAASRPAPAPSAPAQEFERLKQAHDSLRRRVAGAIGQIDELIEAAGTR